MCVLSKDLLNGRDLPGDLSIPLGWIEKDGKVAEFPTHDSENVYEGDTVDVHVEVHINPCYSWSVCLSVCLLRCALWLKDVNPTAKVSEQVISIKQAYPLRGT